MRMMDAFRLLSTMTMHNDKRTHSTFWWQTRQDIISSHIRSPPSTHFLRSPISQEIGFSFDRSFASNRPSYGFECLPMFLPLLPLPPLPETGFRNGDEEPDPSSGFAPLQCCGAFAAPLFPFSSAWSLSFVISPSFPGVVLVVSSAVILLRSPSGMGPIVVCVVSSSSLNV